MIKDGNMYNCEMLVSKTVKARKMTFGVLLELMFISVFFFSSSHAESGGWFRLKKNDYRLQKSVMQAISAKDQITCAYHCESREKPNCKSFNFIVDSTLKQNCELNSKATSTENDANLVPRAGSLYFEKIKADYPTTCSMLKSDEPETPSGYYMIQPSQKEAPFTVFCDMADKNRIGVAVVSHDSEESTRVSGYEGKGAYSKSIAYYDLTMEQIINVINASRFCEQFIKWHCKNAGLFLQNSDPDSWWVSRQGYKMTYWGGATPSSKKCACGMTNSCFDKTRSCNCDVNGLSTFIEDSGFLVNKEYLPVSELRFGDTGDSSEEGYYTLGKLLCWD